MLRLLPSNLCSSAKESEREREAKDRENGEKRLGILQENLKRGFTMLDQNRDEILTTNAPEKERRNELNMSHRKMCG